VSSRGRVAPAAGKVLPMAGIRRAFLWATAGRYVVMALNLATTVVMARLLTPAEYGLAVLGTSAFAIAEAFRGLGGGAYLVQEKELNRDKIRTTYTISLLVTIVMSLIFFSLSGPLSFYYGTQELKRYFVLLGVWFMMGPFVYPILAIMTRELAFGTIAFINIVTALVNAGAIIVCGVLGFGFMSYAWAGIVSTAAGMIASLRCRPDLSIFRPLLREWRTVLAFGVFDSTTGLLFRIWENAPYLLLGRVVNAEAVGLLQRAILLAHFPERVILAGAGAVALPAFSEEVRQGRSLKASYLGAIEHVTGIQWPILILLALFAHPVVAVILGPQWLASVPFVQLIAIALLFYFPIGLDYAALVAVGSIRYMPLLVLVQASLSLLLFSLGAFWYGLFGAVLSALIAVPCNVLLSVSLVRSQVFFRWAELARALSKSALVALCSAAGPLLLLTMGGPPSGMSAGAALLAAALGAAGWAVGLRITRHPLWQEWLRACDVLSRNRVVAALVASALRRINLHGLGR
jgi:O-antigen/teichoic acid export membrane protein